MGGVGEPGLKGDKVIGTLPYCPWVIQVPLPPGIPHYLAPLPPAASSLLSPLHLQSWLLWFLGVGGSRGQLWRPDG